MELNKIFLIHLEFKFFKTNIHHHIATLSIQPAICIETYKIKSFEMWRPTYLIHNCRN